MPSESKTPNIGLNQWQGNEYVKRQDFVDDNNKIDNEIGKIKKQIEGISPDASSITYDNTTSELESDNVQDAIDEVNAKANANETSISSLKSKVDNVQNFKLTTDNGSFIRLENGYNIDTILSGNYDVLNATGTLPFGLNSSDNNILIETKRRGDDYLRQVLYDVRSLNSWERIRKSNAWQSWRQINGGQNLKLTHDDGRYIQTRDTGNIDEPVLGWFNYFNAKGTLPSGYSPTNNDFLIENKGVNTNWIRQTLYDVRSYKKFERMRLDGSWSEWREL